MTTQQLQLKLQKQAQLQQCLTQATSPQTPATTSNSSNTMITAALQGKHRRRSATETNK